MTSLQFIRLCLALPLVLPMALYTLEATSAAAFLVHVVLLVGSPYVPVAVVVWWRLAACRTEASRAKLLLQGLFALLVLHGLEVFLYQQFGSAPYSLATELLVAQYTAVVGFIYAAIALLLYVFLRKAGVFARAESAASGPAPQA